MIEILEAKPVIDHTEILRTLNSFLSKADRCMNCTPDYDIYMETDVITISVSFINLSYHFKGELHAQTLTDLINKVGITYTANQLYVTIRHLIINEIYLRIFSKPVDE